MLIVPSLNLPGLKSDPGKKLVKQRVLAGMKVYPHGDDPVFTNRSVEMIRIDWSPKTDASFRRMGWQKSMGMPAGRWTATIKEKRLGSLSIGGGDILPDDWMDLTILRNGIPIPICRGIIDTVTDTTVGMGATVRTWQLTGRDHGALWEFPIAYQNIYVRTMNELVQGLFTKRVKGKIGGNPSELFEILIKGAFTKGDTSATWVLPDKLAKVSGIGDVDDLGFKSAGAILDILDIDTKGTTRGAYYNEVQLWTKPGEMLGQTISNWCNPLLNEFIYDLEIDKNYPNTGKANSKVSALIRERPFPRMDESAVTEFAPGQSAAFTIPGLGETTEVMNTSPWYKLTTWAIPNWLLQNSSLTRSNVERYNLFELMADIGFGGSEGEQAAMAPPAIYRDSIEKHGLRPMLEHTRYVADASKGKGMGAWVTERKNWQKLLVNWHCLNPWFFSGSIGLPVALAEIRIGQRLRIMSGKIEDTWGYYVEGVGINWDAGKGPKVPPTGHTSLSLTRGWQGTDASLAKAMLKVSNLYKTKF